jgi:hypothetical protein
MAGTFAPGGGLSRTALRFADLVLVDASESLQSGASRPVARRNQQKSGDSEVNRLFRYLIGLIVLVAAGVGGFFVYAASVPAIDPIAPPDKASIAGDLVERGETLAALGDCPCHTREGGQEYAGGRALPTPSAPSIRPRRRPAWHRWSGALTRALRRGIARAAAIFIRLPTTISPRPRTPSARSTPI